MKRVRGLWIPDHEVYLARFLRTGPLFAGAGTYQFRKYAAALGFIGNFGHAVDIGAHCGTWSRVMARCFTQLTAFEPTAEAADCFDKNLARGHSCRVALHRVALGKKACSLRMNTRLDSTAFSRVDGRGDVKVPVRTLDSFKLGSVDFIKIDVEGFEKFVVLGAEETIRASRPVIVVEQKSGNAERYGVKRTAARTLLKQWGAVEQWNIDGDVCMAWK